MVSTTSMSIMLRFTPSQKIFGRFILHSPRSRPISPLLLLLETVILFDSVHGVYKPGNVKLHPELLGKHQDFVKQKLNTKDTKPVFFVFHGGSGSTEEEIKIAVSFGVVKVFAFNTDEH